MSTLEDQKHEYLRRNRQVARAIGAHANAKVALERLLVQQKPPRWLVRALIGIVERTEYLPSELAAWRDQVKSGSRDV